MSCINKKKGFGGRRAKSVRVVPDTRLHQIFPTSGENSDKTPASGFVSEKISARQVSCLTDWVKAETHLID